MIMGAGYAKAQEVVTSYAKPKPSAGGKKTFSTSRTYHIETLL
jgi:hypothetical protein